MKEKQDNWKDYWNEHHKVDCEVDDGPEADLTEKPIPPRGLDRIPSWLQTLIAFAMFCGVLLAFGLGVNWFSNLWEREPTEEAKVLIADVRGWDTRANGWFVVCHFGGISEEEARAEYETLLSERDDLWARIISLKSESGLNAGGNLYGVLLRNIVYRVGPWRNLEDFRRRYPLEEMIPQW